MASTLDHRKSIGQNWMAGTGPRPALRYPHLAGALGRPVLVAFERSPDWCWLLERADSPWYPTMWLFRQRVSGEWDEVFEAISAAVAEPLGERNVAP